MKKALLTLATVLCALAVNAQGLTPVGANVVILPSVKWDKQAYTAKTFVMNSGQDYGDWNEENPNYNVLVGDAPYDDSNGKKWYEPGYDTTDDATIGDNPYTGEEVYWEEHTAPFSSDENYNGLPSYRWTTSSIMAEIYVIRTFTTESLLPNDVYLACSHDDAPCEYYLNGVLVWSEENGWDENKYIKLTDEQKALIKKGEENVLAFHVHQNWGGAYADAGLYTSVPGGLEMGYSTPWTGRTLFNSWGGYNFNGQSQFRNAGANNEWEALYEAGADDVYTIYGIPETVDDWNAQLHFKTPIDIKADHEYTFKATLTPTSDFDNVIVKLCGNDDDETTLYEEVATLTKEVGNDISGTFSGKSVDNLKFVFDLGWGQDGADVAFSKMSLYDETDGKELWIGTSYFNYMYFVKDEKQIKSPKMTGRVESKSWTTPDFDDSQWDETVMPIGNSGYMSEVQTIWPGNKNNPTYEGDGDDGNNTGYWIRRTWNIEKINPKLSYSLNVCHDDDYETYVNGHLLQTSTGWTNGKNPVQVHIPASYLKEGANVIATEIHQNWGGRFYDCGINVEEVDYDACLKVLTDAIAAAEGWVGDLTLAMRAKYNEVIAEAKNKAATELDAAEIKYYAENDFANAVRNIQNCSGTVTLGRQMLTICQNIAGYNGEMNLIRPSKEDFEAFDNVNAINDAVNKMKMARKRMYSERRQEKFTGVPVQAGDFYIFNVGEKMFLGGGEAWGAHAALEYVSNAMGLIPSDGVENGYAIQSYRANGNIGEMDFVNYGGYVDTGNADVWVFVPVEGKTNVYNIRRNGDNGENGVYLGYRGAFNAEGEFDNQNGYSWNVVDSDMRSADLESNQWMLITKEELDAQVANATETNGVDMSHIISNPGFDQRLPLDYWDGANIWGRGENHPDFVHESWNSDCNLSQEIYDDAIIEGWWTLECNGYYRDGKREAHAEKLDAGETPEQLAVLYVNDKETLLKRIDDNKVVIPYTINSTYVYNGVRCPDYPTDAAEFFEHGAYKNVVKFQVTDAGSIYFGVETYGGAPECWTVVDNFRLKYWGTKEPSDEATAIADVNTETPTEMGIYNLQGQKLVKAVKGINIINGKKYVIK